MCIHAQRVVFDKGQSLLLLNCIYNSVVPEEAAQAIFIGEGKGWVKHVRIAIILLGRNIQCQPVKVIVTVMNSEVEQTSCNSSVH